MPHRRPFVADVSVILCAVALALALVAGCPPGVATASAGSDGSSEATGSGGEGGDGGEGDGSVGCSRCCDPEVACRIDDGGLVSIPCATIEDCPFFDCAWTVCDDGSCASGPEDAGTACWDGGECDGEGLCE